MIYRQNFVGKCLWEQPLVITLKTVSRVFARKPKVGAKPKVCKLFKNTKNR